MKRFSSWMALAPAAMLTWAAAVWAAPPPDEVCLAGKEVAAGEYAECRLRAEATFVLNGRMDDYEKAIAECDERLLTKFALLESQAVQAGGECPTVGDAAEMLALITGDTNAIAAALGGAPMGAVCGNGMLEPGEECEWGNPGIDEGNPGRAASCASATGGWLPQGHLGCNPTECTFDTSDCFYGCGGTMVDGVCWILGEVHEPCVCVCSDHSAVYDPITETVGSAGTNEACGAILDALGVPAGPVMEVELPAPADGVDFGVGCAYHAGEGSRVRVTTPATTAAATTLEWVELKRVCACR